MGAMLRITRDDHTGAELRALSTKCTDGAQVRRMLALALVLDGRPRGEAAALNGMDPQTLCDWVHRYNAGGLAGLKMRKSPGKVPLLSAAQKAELRDLVLQGPDPDLHTVVRWRCVDLRAEVARRWSVDVDESTIGKWLGKLGFYTDRDPVPGRGQGRPARDARHHLGVGWITAADGARQSA